MPRIKIGSAFTNGRGYTTLLDYKCFNFGKLVAVRDIAQGYYVGIITAYRLTVSLTTLIDRLVRMHIRIALTIENLLIDLPSSFVTLIDWSEAELEPDLTMPAIADYYQQMARIVIKLTGATYQNNHWICPSRIDDPKLYQIFTLLQQIIDFNYQPPDDLCAATRYVAYLQEEGQFLPQRLVNILHNVEIATRKPLFELMPKNKEGKE